MRIAVTGRNGQVARALSELGGRAGHDMFLLARPEFDLAEPGTVAPVLRKVRPHVVINAAAYTAVDKAESEHDMAEAINARGAGAVASRRARPGGASVPRPGGACP